MLAARPGEQIGGAINLQQHVRAEFYAAGVGWVPVDPAHKKFGTDDGNFLTFHVDPDLEVPWPTGRQSVMLAQSVVYWTQGGGSLTGTTIEQDWQVRALPQRREPPKKQK